MHRDFQVKLIKRGSFPVAFVDSVERCGSCGFSSDSDLVLFVSTDSGLGWGDFFDIDGVDIVVEGVGIWEPAVTCAGLTSQNELG